MTWQDMTGHDRTHITAKKVLTLLLPASPVPHDMTHCMT